jgi:hypothetical protein
MIMREKSNVGAWLVLAWILVFWCAGVGWAKDIEIDGLAESYYAASWQGDHDLIGERSRFRLNFRHSTDKVYMFASLNGVDNRIVEADDDIAVNLHEAYIEYNQESWDVKIGKQIYSWGKADGFRITDILSPCDYSEFMTRDFDEIRIPVESVKFHYIFEASDVDLVWIPSFQEPVMPQSGNPWYINTSDTIAVGDPEKVDRNLRNSEWALRWSFQLKGMDVAFSTAGLWDDDAAWHKAGTDADGRVVVSPQYHRLRFYGINCAKSVDEIVLRFESGFFQGKYFSAWESLTGVMEKDYFKSLIGVDWNPGNNWSVTGQVYHEYILDYDSQIGQKEHKYIINLNVGKKLLRETLKIDNTVYFDCANEAGWERFAVDYALTDSLHIAMGSDWFFADQSKKINVDNQFGRYDGMDFIWMKVKYSF